MEPSIAVFMGKTVTAFAAAHWEKQCRKKAHLCPALLETMLMEEGVFFLWQEHMERLIRSTMELKMPSPPIEAISASCNKIAEQLPIGKFKVRLIVRDTEWMISWYLLKDPQPEYRLFPIKNFVPQGPHKLLNRTQYVMALQKAQNENAHDGLLLDDQQNALESCIGNIWWVNREGIFTTPSDNGSVRGVFQKWLINTLNNFNYRVVEKEVKLPELLLSDEVWLTNSVRKVWGVTIDNEPWHDFQTLQKLKRILID